MSRLPGYAGGLQLSSSKCCMTSEYLDEDACIMCIRKYGHAIWNRHNKPHQ